jgi:hypothetical protein
MPKPYPCRQNSHFAILAPPVSIVSGEQLYYNADTIRKCKINLEQQLFFGDSGGKALPKQA